MFQVPLLIMMMVLLREDATGIDGHSMKTVRPSSLPLMCLQRDFFYDLLSPPSFFLFFFDLFSTRLKINYSKTQSTTNLTLSGIIIERSGNITEEITVYEYLRQ